MKFAQEIMNIMNDIEYGFKDEFGNNIINNNPKKWDEEFYKFYYLLTPEELLDKKCGICWDQVELERYLFEEKNIPIKTYFIYSVDGDKLPSHTILVFEENNKYYWFEHSWFIYRGIHEYNSIKELLIDMKNKFMVDNKVDDNTFVYEYEKPTKHIKCEGFYNYIETQKLIKLNEPLYFYHLVDKDADMKNGLISLKFMYEHELFDLFDENVLKYKDRIADKWNIKKYKGKTELSREEYIDALKIFRGGYGADYIYFFKFPPYKELGNKMSNLLKDKDIYRININDEEVQKNIIDIFYGYDMNNSDNKPLNKKYYQNIKEEEYFKNYDENNELIFSTLNHISIAFKNGNCPLSFLEKTKQ